MTIEQLRQPILQEYTQFVEEYKQLTHSSVSLLCDVQEYLDYFPGKQLRPMLVLLSAKASGTMHYKHILLAAAVELLHNATLMHDDVVDESNVRRGHQSIRGRWGNQVAVLCGDYYLMSVMSVLRDVAHKTSGEIINDTVSIMCQGELKQLANVGNDNINIETYIDIIGGKTASLMSACCELGACIFEDETPAPFRQAMKDYGYHYGLVYQIRDDLNDLNCQHDIKMPNSVDAQQLINEHTHLAQEALSTLPDTSAKQVLLNLLLPSAPQPR